MSVSVSVVVSAGGHRPELGDKPHSEVCSVASLLLEAAAVTLGVY